jgi:hypothetical protein
MKINRKELENLLNMLKSEDKSNTTVVFELFNTLNPKDYIGELLLLYQFGETSSKVWSELCTNSYDVLWLAVQKLGGFTYSNCLTAMLNSNASKDSKDFYLELLNKKLKEQLEELKYPMKELDFSLKFKL